MHRKILTQNPSNTKSQNQKAGETVLTSPKSALRPTKPSPRQTREGKTSLWIKSAGSHPWSSLWSADALRCEMTTRATARLPGCPWNRPSQSLSGWLIGI